MDIGANQCRLTSWCSTNLMLTSKETSGLLSRIRHVNTVQHTSLGIDLKITIVRFVVIPYKLGRQEISYKFGLTGFLYNISISIRVRVSMKKRDIN